MIEAGVLTASNYKQLVLRRKLEVLQRGGNGRAALVTWDSMPERFKQTVISGWGHPREALKRNRVMELVEPDEKAGEFFYRYTYDGGKHLKPEKVTEYTANAQILNACIKLKKFLMHDKRKEGVEQVWKEISEGVNRLDREDYPHTLPENAQRLERKVRDYLKEGYASLIHKGFGNKTAAKVSTEAQEALLLQLLNHQNNFNHEQIAKMYNEISRNLNWKEITGRAVGVWHDKHAMVCDSFRGGMKYLANTLAMQHRRKKPSHPLYYWTMDGWDAELYYQDVRERNGQRVTTYANRPVIVVILDPSAMYPIGYAIGTSECKELIREALRNAVDHVGQLFGERMRPHQLQSDHFAKKAMTPIYEELARMYTPARVKNAKSKIIEPYFNYLNRNYCQYMMNWSGFGITARKENQPNVDMINANKKGFPDFEGVCNQLNAIMEIERRTKHDLFMELWADTPVENRLPMEQDRYLSLFGEETELNRINGGSLSSRTLGEHRYTTYDIEFKRGISDRWKLKYDPRDLSRVLAVNEDETKRFLLECPDLQPMALMDQQPGNAEKRARVEEYNRSLLGLIQESYHQQRAAIAGFAAENPELLKQSLGMHLITDSRGQHKAPLQEAKGKQLPTGNKPSSGKNRLVKTLQNSPIVDSNRMKEIEEKLYAGIDWNDF